MKLTEEQKQQLLTEIQHYLAMDCYDFSVSVGDYEIRGGLFADIDENAIVEELE